MLIVDNADDMDVLEESDDETGLIDYLPESDSGLTLFTTRNKTTARIRDAVGWLEESCELEKELLEDDLNRLLTQHVLAMAYDADGKVKDAIQLFEHIVGIQGRKLTEDDLVRPASQHELARAYQGNGQATDAVYLLKHVRAIQGQVLAEDHPSRLASQHELASAYLANRQVKDAVQLLEHVIAIQERVLAGNHPYRLGSEKLLARAYKAAGLTVTLESQPPSQADSKEFGSSDATTSIAEPEGALPFRSKKMAAPVHDRPSQERGERMGVRGKSKTLWQKLKDK